MERTARAMMIKKSECHERAVMGFLVGLVDVGVPGVTGGKNLTTKSPPNRPQLVHVNRRSHLLKSRKSMAKLRELLPNARSDRNSHPDQFDNLRDQNPLSAHMGIVFLNLNIEY